METIYVDGTFSLFLHIYLQLFTLHALISNKQLPLLYCLLVDKTFDTYTSLIRIIKSKAILHGVVFNPKSIIGDFEK
jgi:hypothetical protein